MSDEDKARYGYIQYLCNPLLSFSGKMGDSEGRYSTSIHYS